MDFLSIPEIFKKKTTFWFPKRLGSQLGCVTQGGHVFGLLFQIPEEGVRWEDRNNVIKINIFDGFL